MLLRYCSNCGTANTVDPARIDKRTFCFACGEVLQVVAPSIPSQVAASPQLPPVPTVPIEQPPLPPPVQVTPTVVAPVVAATPRPVPAAVIVSAPAPTPAPEVAKQTPPAKSRWQHPPSPSVPAPAMRSVAIPERQPTAVAATQEMTATSSTVDLPQPIVAEVATSPTPNATPPAAEPAATPQPAALPKRRFPRLHGSAGFLSSTVVHTIAIVVLALLVIDPPETPQVIAFVSTRPAHQAEEELLVEEFQVVEMEVEVDAIADVSEVESLDATAQVSIAEVSEDVGLNDDSAGQFTLPDGLFARVPGSGGGGGGAVAASSATFAKRLRRENAKTGDVQVSLLWNNFNDIDVHVRCPSGEVIGFDHRNSRCRGELDVDMNAEGRVSDEPVENIYWPAGKAPFGTYFVVVHHYRNHGDPDPTPFEVEVKVDGKVRRLTGELRYGDPPLIVDRFERTKGAGSNSDDDFYVE